MLEQLQPLRLEVYGHTPQVAGVEPEQLGCDGAPPKRSTRLLSQPPGWYKHLRFAADQQVVLNFAIL
jgi:hypothetical protein